MIGESYPNMQDYQDQLHVVGSEQADYQKVFLERLQERSREADLQIAGSLREVAPHTTFAGAISLESRFVSGEITEKDLEIALDVYARSFVPAAEGAPQRCGDGRSQQYAEADEYTIVIRPLGAQSMGSSITPAVAHRLVSGIESDATLEADIDAVRPIIKKLGGEVALHTDDHGDCGCGALKGIEQGLDLYDEKAGEPEVARAIAGANFSEVAYKCQQADRTALPATYAGDKVSLLNSMSTKYGEDSRQVYVGAHGEAFVSLNYRKGEVFNREWYNLEVERLTGKSIQFFNVDAWQFEDQAKEFYPDDTEKQQAYITASAKMQECPARLLTDGTQRVVIRS